MYYLNYSIKRVLNVLVSSLTFLSPSRADMVTLS